MLVDLKEGIPFRCRISNAEYGTPVGTKESLVEALNIKQDETSRPNYSFAVLTLATLSQHDTEEIEWPTVVAPRIAAPDHLETPSSDQRVRKRGSRTVGRSCGVGDVQSAC